MTTIYHTILKQIKSLVLIFNAIIFYLTLKWENLLTDDFIISNKLNFIKYKWQPFWFDFLKVKDSKYSHGRAHNRISILQICKLAWCPACEKNADKKLYFPQIKLVYLAICLCLCKCVCKINRKWIFYEIWRFSILYCNFRIILMRSNLQSLKT